MAYFLVGMAADWNIKKFIFLMYPRKDIKRIPILPFYNSKTSPFMLARARFSLHVDFEQAQKFSYIK